jgi:hypothetical protein
MLPIVRGADWSTAFLHRAIDCRHEVPFKRRPPAEERRCWRENAGLKEPSQCD